MLLIVEPDLYSDGVYRTFHSEGNVLYLCSPVFWPLDTCDCESPEIWLVCRRTEL